MPHSLSSIAYRAILPDRSGLCIVLCKGRLVSTTMGVCLEVGTKLLSCHTEASSACSRQVYRIFASNKDLLTKNIGLCFWFLSYLN